MESISIPHLLSVIRPNSESPAEQDRRSKLPDQIKGIGKEGLQILLTELYRGQVEDRGNTFIDIAGTELVENIEAAAKWMMGSKVKSCLLLRGTLGSGKTTILEALYSLYHRFCRNVWKCKALDVYEQYQAKIDKAGSCYDELKKADFLFLDDLGIESAQFRNYGIDHAPLPELIYNRYDKQLPTVISTNLSENLLVNRYGGRVQDRFLEMCTIVRFRARSYRELLVEDPKE